MNLRFIDSSFDIAFINPQDDDHELAQRLLVRLRAERAEFVTSQAVLLEVLACFSRSGPYLRQRAGEFVERLLNSPGIEVVPLSEDLVRRAVALYLHRLDQRYSLADCVAMVVRRDRGITEVLTTDRDFQAEGFTILMPD
ncbi:MAG: type II toxin-antitoxin system VapC family toxin [Chloroflexi bacterium]|nr:type II toxin-antitoxin system VapC family toxin [Chloroflexota bacterium]